MKHARPLLLVASTFALFISACSQVPENLSALTLEPQFGGADDDIGVDVAVPSVDSVYVVSDQSGAFCEPGEIQRVMLRRYDGRGNLVWNEQVDSLDDVSFDDCDDLRALLLKADTQGNTYTLVATQGVSQDTFKYN